MAVTESFVEYVVELLERVAPVTTKKMFGAIGLYGDGPIFGIIDDDTLYFKTDESNQQRYVDAGSSKMMPGGDPSKAMNYYQVPANVLEDRRLIAEWMNLSLVIARDAKPAAKKRAGSKSAAEKPAGSADSAKKPAGSKSSATKLAGSKSATTKPTGSKDSAKKPAAKAPSQPKPLKK